MPAVSVWSRVASRRGRADQEQPGAGVVGDHVRKGELELRVPRVEDVHGGEHGLGGGQHAGDCGRRQRQVLA
jgi:hypothetical protein